MVEPRTVWRIVGVEVPVELIVASRDEGLVEQIEKAALNAGIVLERVEPSKLAR